MSKYNRKSYELKCANCGDDFVQTSRSYRKDAKYRYCSKKCFYEHKSKLSYEEMCERVSADFKEWLVEKYCNEKLNSRDIAELAYGKRKNGPNITNWMKRLDVPVRSRTDAVALQWKDNPERRKKSAEVAIEYMGAGTEGRKKLIKVMQTKDYKEKQRVSKTGERNGMWNPEMSEEEREKQKRHARRYPGYNDFRRKVYERDNYTCLKCGNESNGNLVVHHLNGFHWDEDSRTEVDNGATLCTDCHKEFHSIYGNRNNDLFQFGQYMNLTLTK